MHSCESLVDVDTDEQYFFPVEYSNEDDEELDNGDEESIRNPAMRVEAPGLTTIDWKVN